MKKEITIGQAVSIMVVLLLALVGWGVNVEVRIATLETKIESIMIMRSEVKETHDAVIRIETWIKGHDRTVEL